MRKWEPYAYLRSNKAPELPNFGRSFVYDGPGGVVTFRIDRQALSHDGLALIGGPVVEEATGLVRDHSELVSVYVTKADYMRLTNSPDGTLH